MCSSHKKLIILIHTSVKLVTNKRNSAVIFVNILIHTSVKLVTAFDALATFLHCILIHTSVKLVTDSGRITTGTA